MKIIHTLTALALCAPIFTFYVVIAGEALGWNRTEYAMLVTPTAFNSLCAAWAKGTAKELGR
jgi:hypothetical protein